MKIAIADIIIGKRHRREMGDLRELAASMKEIGQLQPIGVTGEYQLVWGERRVKAAKLLGWGSVDAIVDPTLQDAVKHAKAERDENSCRKPFSVSEAAEVGEQIEAIEREAAKARQGRPDKVRSGKLPEHTKRGDSRDLAAAVVGMSGRTFDKAKEVAANAAPELLAAVDENKISIDAAAQLSTLSRPDQKNIVAKSDKEILAAAKQIKEQRSNQRRETIQAKQDEKAKETVWPKDESELRDKLDAGETIVVNVDAQPRITAYARQAGKLFMIDRSSEWGNPFYLDSDGTRDEVCDAYAKHYLPHKKSLMQKISTLQGKALGCHCAPNRCHGHGIAKIIARG